MFALVKNVLRLLERALEQLEPERLGQEASLQMFECFVRIERLGAAGKALCSRQVAHSDAWHATGYRSPAHLMAATARSTVGHAVRVLETAEMLQRLPETEAAYRRGTMSEIQAIEVVSAAAANPSFQSELLDSAEADALEELRRKCARIRAGSFSEEERHRRLHRNRQLRHWTDIEGAFRLDGRFTPEAGAVIIAALEPFRQQVARRAAQHRLKESSGALAADALVEMAERSRCIPEDAFRTCPGAAVHVRVDHSALIRGRVESGEVCEVPGVGPIPVKAARALMADAFLAAIVTDGQDVRAVAHLGRSVTAKQRTALLERDQACVVPGCCDQGRLEIDHIHGYALGGPTAISNLARLCHWHHYLKTHHGYRLKRLSGQWLWEGPNGPPSDLNGMQPELVLAR